MVGRAAAGKSAGFIAEGRPNRIWTAERLSLRFLLYPAVLIVQVGGRVQWGARVLGTTVDIRGGSDLVLGPMNYEFVSILVLQ